MFARSCCWLATFLAASASSAAIGSGPDVFVCDIGGTSSTTGFINYGQQNNIRAFAVSTIVCNQGNQGARWDDEQPEPDNAHPVIATNMFRLRDGRFVQIGQAWVKHTNSAAQIDWCTTCQPGGNEDLLGVGCCDAYGVVLNGNYFGLGPKSEINAATGSFPFPFCSPSDGGITCPQPTGVIARRLQVKQTELDTSAGVQYFIEVQMVLPDDAVLANPPTDDNNASYRPISINSSGDLAAWTADTHNFEPAIRAWKQHGLGLNTPDPDVVETVIDVPGDGRFWLAAKATDLGNGTWHYEYAVQNLNSDRSGQSFTVPLPERKDLIVTNIGFYDVDYHSGEPYSLTNWTGIVADARITWATESHSTNVNANALRWGTLYNFRFDTNVPPANGNVALGLFKPGTPESISASSVVPSPLPPCAADISPQGGNGVVDVSDLLLVISSWGACDNCEADIAPPGGDNNVNVSDLLMVVANWGPC